MARIEALNAQQRLGCTRQARNSEHLAGVNIRGEPGAVPRWLRFDRLVLAAIVLGLLLVLLL